MQRDADDERDRGAREGAGERAAQERDADPAGPRGGGRGLGGDGVEDRRAQVRGRLDRVRREGEQRGRLAQVVELAAARLARGDVLLEEQRVVRLERIERVRGDQVLELSVLHGFSVVIPRSSSSARSRVSAVCVRDLIVPSGCPSRRASSDWL